MDFNSNFIDNLLLYMKAHNITAKDLYDGTGYGKSTVCEYLNKKRPAKLDFMTFVMEKYQISLDEFFKKPLDEEELEKAKTMVVGENVYKKYLGTYIMYYLDTSSYKGHDNRNESKSLLYGVMYIYKIPTNRVPKYGCKAVFGIDSREEAEKLKTHFDHIATLEKITKELENKYSSKLYSGDFELRNNFAYFSMDHENRDKLLAIFHCVLSNKNEYIGGLGTVNSASKGRESMPTIQYLGLSRNKTKISDEEIHHTLLLDHPTYKATDATDEILKLIKNLYIDDNSAAKDWTPMQKRAAIQSEIEHQIKRSLENNMFRYAKISNRDDDAWYKTLKDAFLDMQESDN